MSNQDNNKVFVITVKGEQISIDFDADDTVEALKAKIQVATGIPIAEQYPVFEGQLLSNGRDVTEYNLQKEGTITLVTPVKGGGRHAVREEDVIDCKSFWSDMHGAGCK